MSGKSNILLSCSPASSVEASFVMDQKSRVEVRNPAYEEITPRMNTPVGSLF